jgi:4-hydroxy-tetrahydrodipicolinate synthase
MVADHAGPNAARDMARVQELLKILFGYGLTATFKGVMAILTGHAGWRRVRAPLVALTDAEFAALQGQMKAFALDQAVD